MDDKETSRRRWRPRRRKDRLLPGPGLVVSRGFMYLALAVLFTAVVWASCAQLDVVVDARGRLVVRGEPIAITAPEAALVVDLPVQVGQRVGAGDILVKLDAFAHRSEAEHVRADIRSLQAQVARHVQSAHDVAATRSSIVVEIEALDAVVELAREELEKTRTLQTQGIASPSALKLEEQKLLETQARRARSRTELARQAREAAEQVRLADEARGRIAALETELSRLGEYEKRATLRAPVAGTVVRLAMRHPGSVIGTDVPAVILAPDDQPLLACVDLPNASMRRLRGGLDVRLELDAFPQEDFGYVGGELMEIEPDADNAGNYKAWVRLRRAEVAGSSLIKQLKPGLLTRARIVVERRSILAYLLKPIRRLSAPLSVGE